MKKMDHVANLLAAKAMLDELPDAALYPKLEWWTNPELRQACDASDVKPRATRVSCGAVGCFGGWVAATPYFQKLGVECDVDTGAPELVDSNGTRHWPYETGLKLFGVMGMFDERHSYEPRSEREVIEQRIQRALEFALEREGK